MTRPAQCGCGRTTVLAVFSAAAYVLRRSKPDTVGLNADKIVTLSRKLGCRVLFDAGFGVPDIARGMIGTHPSSVEYWLSASRQMGARGDVLADRVRHVAPGPYCKCNAAKVMHRAERGMSTSEADAYLARMVALETAPAHERLEARGRR